VQQISYVVPRLLDLYQRRPPIKRFNRSFLLVFSKRSIPAFSWATFSFALRKDDHMDQQTQVPSCTIVRLDSAGSQPPLLQSRGTKKGVVLGPTSRSFPLDSCCHCSGFSFPPPHPTLFSLHWRPTRLYGDLGSKFCFSSFSLFHIAPPPIFFSSFLTLLTSCLRLLPPFSHLSLFLSLFKDFALFTCVLAITSDSASC